MINKDIMKSFIQQKLRESLLEEEQLNEVNWKGLAAGAAMTLGTLGAQGQTTPPTTQAPTTQTTQQKPMFGTPEQRAAAKAKRESQRKKNEDLFIMGAMRAGFYDEVSDEEYAQGCQLELNDPNEVKDVVYRKMDDSGMKFKVDLKDYRKYLKKMGKKADAGLEGMQDPSFTSTSCGISKAGAKQSKKDFKKK
jgi:hypothetical protein